MELAEKLRRLRSAEGVRRGLWRTLTQHEVIRAMRQEIGVSLSQAYLSQLENGRRAHLTSATREALARFYHVQPGYLMSDPPGSASAPLPPVPADVPDTPASPAAELAALERHMDDAPPSG
jgi:transcriptional regulator with XRE-family HTH domain